VTPAVRIIACSVGRSYKSAVALLRLLLVASLCTTARVN